MVRGLLHETKRHATATAKAQLRHSTGHPLCEHAGGRCGGTFEVPAGGGMLASSHPSHINPGEDGGAAVGGVLWSGSQRQGQRA